MGGGMEGVLFSMMRWRKECCQLNEDRTESLWEKVALNGEIINTKSAYAPQTGCGENEKIKFWEEMDEELRDIPDTEKLWVGGDFNGHCGRNNSGKEETIGKYGVGESNEAESNIVAVCNDPQYESGEHLFWEGWETQYNIQ